MQDTIQLEKRYCLCGCGASFKVWPKTSLSWFASSDHAYKTFTNSNTPANIRAIAKQYIEWFEGGRQKSFKTQGAYTRWKKLEYIPEYDDAPNYDVW